MDRPSLLLTRPQTRATRFVSGLDQTLLKGVTVCISPLLEIVPTDCTVDLTEFSGVIFTSSNGVAFAPIGNQRSAFCVGAQTAQDAQANGWVVKGVAQTADELVALLESSRPTGPLAHLAGTHRRGEIAARIGAMGTHVEVHALYDQVLRPLSAQAQNLLAGEAPVIVPLFSPRTAVQFGQEAIDTQRVRIVAISAAVAAALGECRVAHIKVADVPTRGEMQRNVELLLRSVSSA